MIRSAVAPIVAVAALLTTTSPAAAQSADSLLAVACGMGGGVAEGLLVVVFRPDLEAARRDALAREVGGRVAGPAAEAGPNGYYIVMPAEGRSALDAAADRLIRQDGVQEVGGAVCPPPEPAVAADTAAATPVPAADSLRADTTAAAPGGPGDAAAAVAPADTAGP